MILPLIDLYAWVYDSLHQKLPFGVGVSKKVITYALKSSLDLWQSRNGLAAATKEMDVCIKDYIPARRPSRGRNWAKLVDWRLQITQCNLKSNLIFHSFWDPLGSYWRWKTTVYSIWKEFFLQLGNMEKINDITMSGCSKYISVTIIIVINIGCCYSPVDDHASLYPFVH